MNNRVKIISKGDRFEDLVILSDNYEILGNKAKRAYYSVICDCGEIFKTSGTALRTKRIKSCKNCSFKKRSLKSLQIPQINQIFRRLVKDRCIKHKIEFNINEKDYEKLSLSNCYYCGSAPRKTNRFNNRKYVNIETMYSNGVDRIDSNKGYLLDNCVSCCTSCNYAKHKLSQEDFYKKIIMIYNNLNLKNYISKEQEGLSQQLDL